MKRRDLLEHVNLPDLISTLAGGDAVRGLTHERGGVICDPRPGCSERTPSFSVYRQGAVWLWKRHGGDEASGSAFDLLLAFGYSEGAAWDELARWSGLPLPARGVGHPVFTPAPRDPLQDARSILDRMSPFTPEEVRRARDLLAPLREGDGPSCELLARGLLGWPGLQVGKLRRSYVTPDGRQLGHVGALAFLVIGPDGLPWALKVRNTGSGELLSTIGLCRYVYRIGGHGAPAWCSPHYGSGGAVLLVEGELNGAAAACALEAVGARVDVQGLAGAGGTPFLDGLAGRRVYLYADPDRPGRECVERLARVATAAGAAAVHVLRPLEEGDFCEVSGERGAAGLGFLILDLMDGSTIHHTVSPSGASAGSVAPHHQTPRAGVVVEAVLQKYRAKLGKKIGGKR